MPDFAAARERMVEQQIAARGVDDPEVLAAMRAVPREMFVAPELAASAYQDRPLGIGEQQTISQPYVVALMIAAAGLKPGDRVLEIGTGSGYAAAVMSRIAARVYTVERHASLNEAAQRRFAELQLDNIDARVGDGTLGWPEAAPFDAIVVAAGGPEFPQALKRQLRVGGRLVMPVGFDASHQELRKLTRREEDDYELEDLGAVAFVPLIGEQGWSSDNRSLTRSIPELIARAAAPLPDPADPDFAQAFDRFAGARVVLLGEASHGTAEFYRARAAITRRLIERHGFNIVAVEADWPDAATVDRYVRHLPPRPGEPPPFQRFPTWMWRNTEVAALVGWMRDHNAGLAPAARASFRGLDMYSLSDSVAAVLAYLAKVDPEAAATARERYGCLEPWRKSPERYGRVSLTSGYGRCEEAVNAQCRDLLQHRLDYAARDPESFLDAAANAQLIASAEQYYRAMYHGGPESWNLRDRHMFATLERLLEAGGPQAKAIVWAHNSHIGDARRTAMGWEQDEVNIGQLCRERFGEAATLIGFGTHAGTVAAASDWDREMEVKRVRPSRADSCERLFHDAGLPRGLLAFADHEALRDRLAEPRLERFIGVIYQPETELQSHYARAALAQQFDAYVWFDETTAVTPLGPEPHGGAPKTFPFGT